MSITYTEGRSEGMPGKSVAKFIVPDWGDKVDSGTGLSYWSARLHREVGRYDNESTISPIQGL